MVCILPNGLPDQARLQLQGGTDRFEVVRRFGFNAFAVQLNSLPAELQNILPPTDSRLREDLQAVERGEYSKAFTSPPPELTLLDNLRQGVPCLFISDSAFAAEQLQAI